MFRRGPVAEAFAGPDHLDVVAAVTFETAKRNLLLIGRSVRNDHDRRPVG
jgi:hypothetical protein